MVKHTRKVALAVAALVAMALGGSALAQAGSKPTKQSKPAVTRHVAAKHAKAKPRARAHAAQAGAPDAETADGTNEAESTNEAAGSEVPNNDGPGGHADEPGNPSADHQFEGQE